MLTKFVVKVHVYNYVIQNNIKESEFQGCSVNSSLLYVEQCGAEFFFNSKCKESMKKLKEV